MGLGTMIFNPDFKLESPGDLKKNRLRPRLDTTISGDGTWTSAFSKTVLVMLVQFSSVAQSCPTLCNPINCSMPVLPVHHQLPEFSQIHVHRVSDAIQPSHPLSSPSPPAANPSQHQGLF